MGSGGPPAGVQKATLLTAASLALCGFAMLAVVGDAATPPTDRFVSPTPGARPSTTFFDFLDPTSTTWGMLGRTSTTQGFGDNRGFDRSRNYPPGTVPPPGESDDGAEPTQVDVSIPVAGAQASAGEGPDSCTNVEVSALTPEGCPEPSGDGPVVVRHPEPPPP